MAQIGKVRISGSILVILLLISLSPAVSAFHGDVRSARMSTSSEWTHFLTLDTDFEVMWTAADPYYLVMEITAPTTGYVGLGFSPSGGMRGADLVIGWVDPAGVPHLRDFHAIVEGPPIQDKQQDYELIAAEERDNKTTVRFRRRWETCDIHDMIIGNDTMRLIWAWHPDDPSMSDDDIPIFQWHGPENRGVRSVYMRSPARPKWFPDEIPSHDPTGHSWDLTMNNVLVDGSTENTYLCRIVKFPHWDRTHHMIGFRPIISTDNLEYVHHMHVYHCQVPEHLGGTEKVFEKFHEREAGECYAPNMPVEWNKHCFTFLFAWAIGSEGEMLPEHVGSPLGGLSGESSYFKLEIHYYNPARRTFIDSSGMRVFHTETPRPNEATTLFIGHRTTPFQMIPYGQEKFTTYSFCAKECTERGINPSTGIKAISVMLHAHLAGRRIRLRHIRKGKELPPIAEDNNYDFNYQQFRILSSEVEILPGDELLVECEYETLKRDRFVFGGPDTEQEMCQAVLFYYPRSSLTDCRSQPELYSFFKPLGIDNVTGHLLEKMQLPYDGQSTNANEYSVLPADNAFQLLESTHEAIENPFDFLKITKPPQMKNMTVGDRLREIRWNNPPFIKKVENAWRNGLHYTFCGTPAQKRIITRNYAVHYPKFREYKNPVKSACRGVGAKYQKGPTGSHESREVEENAYQQHPAHHSLGVTFNPTIFSPALLIFFTYYYQLPFFLLH